MAEIDEISQALGRLEAIGQYQNKELSNIRGDLSVVKNDTQKLSTDSVAQELAIRALHDRMDIIEPKVNQHEAIKNKGLGIMSLLGFIMGGTGWAVSTFLHKIWP